MRPFLLILFVCIYGLAGAQPYLKPSIGIGALPSNNAPICSIPTFHGDFATSGYNVGDTIPDFTLYTVNGVAVNMATVLQSKKPALLVAGSYTCPVYRTQVTDLNAMAAFYGSSLNIYIIYTVEAHPSTDPSPYSGTIWVTSQNTSAGILFPQPTTYAKRKAMVDTMKAHMSITPQILIDGPCNEWWSHFGPAPNNAYLVDTNGRVRAKNGWYDKLPDNMWCSIDTQLGTSSGKCSNLPANAGFSFRLLEDSVTGGSPGSVLTIHGMLKNMSTTNGTTIDIQKIQKNLPAGWESALCTDVCLGPSVDVTQVIIPPADSQSFIFYFYTGSSPASGSVTIGLSNPNITNNKMKQGYHATTWPAGVTAIGGNEDNITVYPNPATGELHLRAERGNIIRSVEVYDATGRGVRSMDNVGQSEMVFERDGLSSGFYVFRLRSRSGVVSRKIVFE